MCLKNIFPPNSPEERKKGFYDPPLIYGVLQSMTMDFFEGKSKSDLRINRIEMTDM